MSSAAPSVQQLFTTALFVMPRGADDRGWSAFLLSRNSTPPPPPDNSISIEKSFLSYTGQYLFALAAPVFADEVQANQFIAKVRSYIDGCFGSFGGQYNGRACVWIPDVSNPAAPGFGQCGGYGFPFAADIGGPVLQSNFNNPMATQMTMAMGQGTPVSYNESGLVFNRSGGVTGLSFLSSPVSNRAPQVAGNQGTLPFVGQYSGCFLMSGTLDTAVTLDYYSAGLRYTHGGSQDVSQRYPVVDTAQPNTRLNYVGAVDPLDPLNASTTGTVDINNGLYRTLFSLAQSGVTAPQLRSWLRTTDNKAILMMPVGIGTVADGPGRNAGAIVLEASARQQPIGTIGPVYMTFAGDYALAVPDTSPRAAAGNTVYNLLCGLFGSETMAFMAYTPNGPISVMRFLARRDAYASIFPFAAASIDNPTSGAVGKRLTGEYRTSWMTIVGGGTYDAQPEDSPLFEPKCPPATAEGGAQEAASPVLTPFAAGTKLLNKPGFAVPFVPYAGLGAASRAFSPTEISTFESQIISPTRKALVSESVNAVMVSEKLARRERVRQGVLFAADTATSTTTPQGLLASVASGSVGADYRQVTLAQSEKAAGRPPFMRFWNLEMPLQNLLQSNQLFSVIVNPEFLGELVSTERFVDPVEPTFDNTITIADWTMSANVGNGVMATDYRNVMIMKFGEGTVVDRVRNPNKWVGTAEFSLPANAGDPGVSLTGLSQWLQDFIAAAADQALVKKNPLYANFVRIVNDPSWNGILVLRADVNSLPDQIRGLSAGIDFTAFEAHHFGITVSRVRVDGCQVTLDGASSMFGLIDYQYPLFRQNVATGGNPDVALGIPVAGPYGFTVLQLQALFVNSALADFQSRVQLTTNSLFDSRVLSTYTASGRSASNAVVLKGSYQAQGTTATYVFEQSGRTVFLVDSNVFNAIAFTRVQFNTLSGGDAQSTITSRFLIWGTFDFARLADGNKEPYDILSFGTPNGTAPVDRGSGLAYSNLQISLSSPADAPNAVTFVFGGGGIAFDLASSTSRAGSMFPTFALQIDSFIAASPGKRPVDFGFLPVRASVPTREISGPWYGVVYKITMGTPGALVSGAGFESRMLVAWSPQTLGNDITTSVFVGLQLPGANPGAKLISLQGVLKVSVASIVLTYDQVQGSASKAFNLRLNDIGLKFFGIVKLPPGATINFFLFGNPTGSGSLGWYAAYKKDNIPGIAPLGADGTLALPEPGTPGIADAANNEGVIAAEEAEVAEAIVTRPTLRKRSTKPAGASSKGGN